MPDKVSRKEKENGKAQDEHSTKSSRERKLKKEKKEVEAT